MQAAICHVGDVLRWRARQAKPKTDQAEAESVDASFFFRDTTTQEPPMRIPLKRPQALPFILTALVIFNLAPDRARAAIQTWTGGATPDGNWQTANNWGGITPAPNDVLTFIGVTQLQT